jgi:hypothetical protein
LVGGQSRLVVGSGWWWWCGWRWLIFYNEVKKNEK